MYTLTPVPAPGCPDWTINKSLHWLKTYSATLMFMFSTGGHFLKKISHLKVYIRFHRNNNFLFFSWLIKCTWETITETITAFVCSYIFTACECTFGGLVFHEKIAFNSWSAYFKLSRAAAHFSFFTRACLKYLILHFFFF